MAGEAISKAFLQNPCQDSKPPVVKKKRNLPGTPDPDAEVIALSPKTLLATNRFLCEICGKGFQRDQNLQLHRRGHNLPWKLRQRSTKEPRKRVYVCPEKSCIHHNPSRALGDLTGIKKHFCRKHGEKKWKCDKCSKRYAVQSDWKAHSKTCGTREYRCDCGTLFSRRDSFITHRAFCDALAEEAARVTAVAGLNGFASLGNPNYHFTGGLRRSNMLQHLSSGFKPIMTTDDTVDQTMPGLALWMGHGPQGSEPLSNNNGVSLSDMHQIGPVSGASLYGDPLRLCSTAQHLECPSSWTYNNKLFSPNSGELMSTSLPTSSVKESDSSHPLLVSVPSLYSTQHHQHTMPAADMSATALLQKASQIGMTSTVPSFLGSFDIKCNNSQIEDSNKLNILLNPGHTTGSNLQNAVNDIAVSNLFDMYSTKNRASLKDDFEGGETRDFLGVGLQTLCSSSINGWI